MSFLNLYLGRTREVSSAHRYSHDQDTCAPELGALLVVTLGLHGLLSLLLALQSRQYLGSRPSLATAPPSLDFAVNGEARMRSKQ